jgi:hypothetical protein
LKCSENTVVCCVERGSVYSLTVKSVTGEKNQDKCVLHFVAIVAVEEQYCKCGGVRASSAKFYPELTQVGGMKRPTVCETRWRVLCKEV